MFRLTYKYRLYPTAAQETALRGMLATARDVYNSLLNWRKHDYEVQGKSPSCGEQEKALPLWKKAHPELCEIYSQVLQDVCKRVDRAFDAFFRRVREGDTPGFPRFKGKGQYDSLTYPQSGYKVLEQAVSLSKIGTVKAVLHRPVEGTIKTCTVRRQSGKWYVCFAVEVGVSPLGMAPVPLPSPEAEPLPESTEQVGIDVGLNAFAALSNGGFVENPRFFRKEEKALAKAQRKADKLKHARSQEQKAARRKAYKVVSRIHERIRNRRHDFVHQLSRKIVNRFGLIAVEKLNVKNMSKSPAPKQDQQTGEYLPNGASAKAGLNKSILDAAWSMFRSVLTHKAEWAGRQEVNVNPACPTGIPVGCSRCGQRVPKPLSERVHVCPCCGLVLDRDVNAARNILKIAVGQHSVPA
jgi:putative transposase